MVAIKAEGLTKRYKDILAVDGLDLEIAEGELFALLGVNGAGKSTTIKMLCCLAHPTAGDAWVGGHSIAQEQNRVKSIIGISPQETAVAPNLTVKENLAFMAGIYGFSKEQAAERVSAISEMLGLGEVLARKAGKLSGGWQRRLSLAMALITEPEILFLDEPTLGLDVLARAELWDIIRGLRGRVTVVLTTHYMEEAESLADRIGIMSEGNLVTVGTPAELMARTETSKVEEAFIKIIKEGRKFGTFLTISSQRPSDISDTIISQLHNYFIHRLVNEEDLRKIYRTILPLQECSRCYGEYLHFIRIKTFSDNEIDQTELFQIKASNIKTNKLIKYDRIHTYNRASNFETIDLLIYQFSLKKYS